MAVVFINLSVNFICSFVGF